MIGLKEGDFTHCKIPLFFMCERREYSEFHYSLLGFFVLFFALLALRSIITNQTPQHFIPYTILSSTCAAVVLAIILGVL